VRINTALQKMRAGKPAFGYTLSLGSPLAAEALANTGPDFVMLDGQHGSFGLSGDVMIYTFMALAAAKAAALARVARNDYTLIGKLLDEGALGVVDSGRGRLLGRALRSRPVHGHPPAEHVQ
jgi:4-hydroxy-2-oxoheptanedioate aldolase